MSPVTPTHSCRRNIYLSIKEIKITEKFQVKVTHAAFYALTRGASRIRRYAAPENDTCVVSAESNDAKTHGGCVAFSEEAGRSFWQGEKGSDARMTTRRSRRWRTGERIKGEGMNQLEPAVVRRGGTGRRL